MTAFASIFSQLESIGIAYFGRAGDQNGLEYWQNEISSVRSSIADVTAAFAISQEAIAKSPNLANAKTADLTAFDTGVYQSLFNRAPDAVGLD